MNTQITELAEYLVNERSAIIDDWKRLCEADDELDIVSRLTRSSFRNNIPAALDGLCRAIRNDASELDGDAFESDIAKHGHHRWKQGFNLRQVIRDWGHLNRVLVKSFNDYFENESRFTAEERTEALDVLASFITSAQSSSVRRFDELRQAEAHSLIEDLTSAKQEFELLTEARGQMLREAAHDIRGGLSAVAGASAVLKLSTEANGSFSEVLDALEHSVSSIRGMLDSLLDLSRLESGVHSPDVLTVNVAEVLEQLAEEHAAAAETKGIELKTDGPTELTICTDPQMVRRIAQNLLVNALQHTCQGSVKLSWRRTHEHWELQVRDTGPGIQSRAGSPVAQELNHPDLDRNSNDYNVSHAMPGEGIGLTIVRRLCDLLDAGVSLDSQRGQGTTFTVQFPLSYDGKGR